MMKTYFATPERASASEIKSDLIKVCESEFVKCLLDVASGLVAVLNIHRQILLVNDAYLEALGIDDPDSVLGLRPGESLGCIHATEMPAGCGTSKFCQSCGAAVAIVTSKESPTPVEELCTVCIKRDGASQELCFRVKACRLRIGSSSFILVFIQDVTSVQQWAAMERIFLHDIGNLVTALEGASEILRFADEQRMPLLAHRIRQMATRLAHEISLQKILLHKEFGEYELTVETFMLSELLQEARTVINEHPCSRNRSWTMEDPVADVQFSTDFSLVLRVLINMLTNAFEATDEGGTIRSWLEPHTDSVTFCLWNQKPIPSPLAIRVFQRHFTTHREVGRGLGTFSMKLLGEQLLGGKVSFTSSEKEGTVFRFQIPLSSQGDSHSSQSRQITEDFPANQ
ncbi:MAG TPA: HAMP domain-containing sensor histidine kinase [bacterium]|nr:HAMP domain-containing sensor histidine kinase [bacterium]